METKYRASVRTEVPLQVFIHYESKRTPATKVRDLSTEGAFIEMSPEELPEGAHVETVLCFQMEGKPVEYRLSARVVRVTDDGVGLKFDSYDDETYTRLVNLLCAYGHHLG